MRSKTWWIAPLILLAAIFVGAFFVYRAAKPSAEDQARSVLEATVRDPDSLQLRNVRRVANGGICGEVNARNGFGGFTGYQRFFLVGSFVSVEGETDLTGAVVQQCGDR